MRGPALRRRAGVALSACALVLTGCRLHSTLELLERSHPEVLYSVETERPVLALTIDDGPDPVSTRRILDVLAQNEAKATFFLIADRIPGNETLVAEIVAAGHELGNHMTRDEPSIDLEADVFERELLLAHDALSGYGASLWFRPGSGWYDDRMLQTLSRHGYRCALGSSYPLDAQIGSSWLAQRFILWRARPGAVIILHDGGERGERTARTLAAVLPELRRRGYRVVSLGEIDGLANP